MIYYGKGKKQYELLEPPLNKTGGEGIIYNVNGNPNIVAKIYKPNKLNPEKERKLIRMIDFPPDKSVLSQIAWPRDVLYSTGIFVGFVMPKMKVNEDLNVMYEFGDSAKYPDMPWENKIIIAENLCVVLDGIHNSGHVCGDLNPKNISVNPQNGFVVFLDTDSYHIQDGIDTYRCDVGITEYLPAEVQRKMRGGSTLVTASLPTFSQDSDNFALSIHIFQLLMNGVHPFACAIIPSHSSVTAPQPSDNIEKGAFPFMQNISGIKIPVYAPPIKILPKNIQDMFKSAFIDGHRNSSARPKPVEWHKELDNLRKNLKNCKIKSHHQYHNSLSSCPWCDADKAFSNSIQVKSSGLQQMSMRPPVSPPISTPSGPSPLQITQQASAFMSSLLASQSSSRSSSQSSSQSITMHGLGASNLTSTPSPSSISSSSKTKYQAKKLISTLALLKKWQAAIIVSAMIILITGLIIFGNREAIGVFMTINELSKEIENNPESINAYNERGLIFTKNKEYDKAIDDFDQVIRLNNDSYEGYYNRGNAFYSKKEYEKAIEDYSYAILLKPDYAEAYDKRAISYRENKDYNSALSNHSEAIRINPDMPDFYVSQGITYRYNNEYDKAIEIFRKAIQLDHDNVTAYRNLGRVQSLKGNYSQAIDIYDNAIRLGDNSAEVYYYRGHAYANMHEMDNAIKEYNKAIKRNKQFYMAYIDRGIAYANIKKHDKAISDLNRAIGIDINNTEAFYYRGVVNYLRGSKYYGEALQDLSNVIRIDSNYSYAYNYRGIVYNSSKNYGRAITEFEAALRIDPTNETFRKNLESAKYNQMTWGR